MTQRDASGCDGKGPIRHAAGECPWCDQEMFNEEVDRQIRLSRGGRCEFCGQYTRAGDRAHTACLREYDRSVNPNG